MFLNTRRRMVGKEMKNKGERLENGLCVAVGRRERRR